MVATSAVSVIVAASTVVVVPTAATMAVPVAAVIAVPATAFVITRCRLIVARCRLVITRLLVVPRCWLVVAGLRVIRAASAVIGATCVVVSRCGGCVDLGAVIRVRIRVWDATGNGKHQRSKQKNSSIHGGLLDRGLATPATLVGDSHLIGG